MGLPIGHRNGLPRRTRGSGIYKITSRHGIPFYNPISLFTPHDYIEESSTDIDFFVHGNLRGQLEPAEASAEITFRLVAYAILTGTLAPVISPESEQIKGETTSHFWTHGILKAYHRLAGESWLVFDCKIAVNKLVGSADLIFTNAAIINNNALRGQAQITFTESLQYNRLTGVSLITFSQSAVHHGRSFLSGTTTLTFASSGIIDVVKSYITGLINIIDLAYGCAYLQNESSIIGHSSIAFDLSASSIQKSHISGEINIIDIVYGCGYLKKSDNIDGSASITFSTAMSSIQKSHLSGEINVVDIVYGCAFLERNTVNINGLALMNFTHQARLNGAIVTSAFGLYSGGGHGEIYNDSMLGWANTRNAVQGMLDTNDPYRVGVAYDSVNLIWSIRRFFMAFDLTSLAGRKCISAELQLGLRSRTGSDPIIYGLIGTQDLVLRTLDFHSFTFGDYILSGDQGDVAQPACGVDDANYRYLRASISDCSKLQSTCFGGILKIALIHDYDAHNQAPSDDEEQNSNFFQVGECLTNCVCTPALIIRHRAL